MSQLPARTLQLANTAIVLKTNSDYIHEVIKNFNYYTINEIVTHITYIIETLVELQTIVGWRIRDHPDEIWEIPLKQKLVIIIERLKRKYRQMQQLKTTQLLHLFVQTVYDMIELERKIKSECAERYVPGSAVRA